MAAREDGLRLLSLDGGGIRGLSALLILQEMMKRIQRDKKLPTAPLPCEYFNLIGGTSTGGLIAIMLGRLGMSVEDAIIAYGALAQDVFSESKRGTQEGTFKATKLKQAITSIVSARTVTPSAPDGNADERMLDPRGDSACKVFVCAMSSASMANCTRFRTYRVLVNETHNCFIWEAARATSAAPTLFKPIAIGTPPLDESFVDGGLRCNNPITEVLAEAYDLWPDRKVACVVSIGTGWANRIGIPPSTLFTRTIPLDVIHALEQITTDCEKVAAECERRFLDTEGVYARFSVEQGLQNVALGEWKKMRIVKAHTDRYLCEPQMVRKIDTVVQRLQSKEGTTTMADMRGIVVKTVIFFSSTTLRKQPTAMFTGRGNILEDLCIHFSPNSLATKHRRMCLFHGLGGSGKTQTTLKFISDNASLFSKIFWIDASSDSNIKQGLKDISRELKAGETPDDALVWFASNTEEWLVVFDNADNLKLPLRNYLPGNLGHGNIIITSRSPHWRGLGPTLIHEISRMSAEEATELMLKLAVHTPTPSRLDETNAQALVKLLAYHALAIAQAGAYISTRGVTIPEYQADLADDRSGCLQQDSAQQTDHGARAVYATFELTFASLSSSTHLFLHMCSYFHYDGLSKAIFSTAVENIQQEEQNLAAPFLHMFSTASGAWIHRAYSEIIYELTSYSLIRYDPETSSFSVHPLLHAWARDRPWALESLPVNRELAEDVLGLCIDTLKETTASYIFQKTLLPHIDELVKERVVGAHPRTLWRKFSKVYMDNGRWATYADLQAWILEIEKNNLGEEHSNTLATMHNLAHSYYALGRFGDAAGLQEHAVTVQERILGQEHPQTLIGMSNLAVSYRSLGQFGDSVRREEHVLAVRKRILGEEHPDTLTSMNNLATSYQSLGQFNDAVCLEEHVLAARKRILGEEHPDTLITMNNLARSYWSLDQFSDAVGLQEHVLTAQKRILGEEHPITLGSMNNLASSYRSLRRFSDAVGLQEHVLAAQKRILGEEHPSTLNSMNNLATLYLPLGKLDDAVSLLEPVLIAQKRILGEEHPGTLNSMNSLATLYYCLGQFDRAVVLQEDVLTARKRTVGEEHSDTLTSMKNLAFSYRSLGRLDDAVGLENHVLATQNRIV